MMWVSAHPGGRSGTERRREIEHDAELLLRAALVLAEVRDQVAERDEIDRPEEVGALDAEEVGLEPAARDEDEHRVERRRGRSSPGAAALKPQRTLTLEITKRLRRKNGVAPRSVKSVMSDAEDHVEDDRVRSDLAPADDLAPDQQEEHAG